MCSLLGMGCSKLLGQVKLGRRAFRLDRKSTRLNSSHSQISYAVFCLKKKLSALGAPVARATLTLFCRDGAPDGGTVYPVGDSRWVEGTRHGETTASAAGPGLKWTDLDTNGNGTLDAADTSPFLPDRSRPLAGIGLVVAGQPITV